MSATSLEQYNDTKILTAKRSTDQNQSMIAMLEDLKGRVTEHDRQLISDLLAQVRHNTQFTRDIV